MESKSLAPAEVVRLESLALEQLAQRMEGAMAPAVDAVVSALWSCAHDHRSIVAIGMGKSGHIARKFVATLHSYGIAAQFLHAGEAAHGDLGLLQPHSAVVMLSYSGETDEMLALLDTVTTRAKTTVCLTGCVDSSLARAARFVLDVGVDEEACSLRLAPTASTAVMLAMCDALAVAVSQRLGVSAEDFAEVHPGGRIGRRLQHVGDLMHTGEQMPRVTAEALLPDVIHEMSAKRLGMTTVVDAEGTLLGVISDGDLRRLLERDGGAALARSAGEVMTASSATVQKNALGSAALESMEAKKITALVVVDDAGRALGVVHLHDLWQKL